MKLIIITKRINSTSFLFIKRYIS